MSDDDLKEMMQTKKCGSLIYSTFVEGECDYCIAKITEETVAWMREDHPEWFDGGNLRSDHIDTMTKKVRSELARRVKKQTVWQVNCGFCFEPFGVCVEHLRDIWDELRKKGLMGS